MPADGYYGGQTPHQTATPLPKPRFLDRSSPPHIMTLVTLSGVSALCMNVFLPALPVMTAYFETEYALMQLSVAVFLGVNAAMQLFIGSISDLFGRRPVLIWGFVLFLLATLGCIYAANIWIFLAFRAAQAFVVTGMVLSRAVVRDMFDADQSASMIGYVTMGMAVVPMVSPMIGGYLSDAYGWHSVFWMIFVVGVGSLALGWADMGETVRRKSASLTEQFREYPELLTAPRFWAYCLAAAFSAGAFFAYLGGAPYVGEVYFDMPPSELGVFFGAPAAGYFVGNFISGRYSVRFGINAMLSAGSIIVPLGMVISLAIFFSGFGNKWVFFGFMSFVGLGNGMVIPNATAAMLSVRPQLAGTASGLGGAMMLGGGALLSALAGVLLTPESGPFPLLWLMVATSLSGFTCAAYAWIRSRRLMGL